MNDPIWPSDAFTRWSRRALRLATRLVPFELRREWHAEWEAELWHARAHHGIRRVLRLLAGAFWHGAWERKEAWRVSGLIQDVRFAVRTLARRPGFAATAIAMLGLAIGANTALFTVLEEAMLSDPPFPDPDRVVVVDMLFGSEGAPMRSGEWSYPRYQALGASLSSFEGLAGYGSRTMTLTDLGEAVVITAEVATPSLFPLLGVAPERGRLFGSDEEDAGSAVLAALVSESFWRTRLGSAPDVVGSAVTLDGLRFRVVGVLPPGFDGITGGAEVWIPFSAMRAVEDPTFLDDPWNQYFHVLGRLHTDASLDRARAEVQAFGNTVMERFPGPAALADVEAGADIVAFQEARMNPVARTSLLALSGAVVLVLLIATANLAGLLLVRGAARGREAAIRTALGAGRSRLLRQLLTESVVLACLGGLVGVGLAWLSVDTLAVWLADAVGTGGGRGLEYFDADALSVNWKVLAFAVTVTGGVGTALGVLPAWQLAHTDVNASLKGDRGRRGREQGWVGVLGRDGLIAVQVAVTLVLLAAASLMVRSTINLQRVDLGYDPAGLLTAMYSLTPADEEAGVDLSAFHTDFLERIRALPGVTGATLGEVPMGGPTWRTIVFGSDGRPDLKPEMHTWIRLQPVSDGHLEVLGARLREGRDLARTDDADSEKVVVLSQSASELLFPDGSPIGRRVRLGWIEFQTTGATVVGVVDDLRLDSPREPIQPQAYLSVRQAPRLQTGVMIRAAAPEALVPAVRSELAAVAPNVALTSVMTMEERAAATITQPRVITSLLTFFSLAALVLVAAGLYGAIAFSVAQRTREIGVRASLGADSWDLTTLVVRRGLGVTLAGIGVGAVASAWATRLLGGLLFGTSSFEPATLLGVAATLVVVAGIAAYLPVRGATRTDPMVALRLE